MDKYDEEIEQIVGEIVAGGSPAIVIRTHWRFHGVEQTRLFAYCSPSGGPNILSRFDCGCLTQVRAGLKVVVGRGGVNQLLTGEIMNDKNLHKSPVYLAEAIDRCQGEDGYWDVGAIKKVLRPYAEWQRRLDHEVRSV